MYSSGCTWQTRRHLIRWACQPPESQVANCQKATSWWQREHALVGSRVSRVNYSSVRTSHSLLHGSSLTCRASRVQSMCASRSTCLRRGYRNINHETLLLATVAPVTFGRHQSCHLVVKGLGNHSRFAALRIRRSSRSSTIMAGKLVAERSILFVCDIQERFRSVIHGFPVSVVRNPVRRRCKRFLFLIAHVRSCFLCMATIHPDMSCSFWCAGCRGHG